MSQNRRERILDELLQNADRIKEMELQKLDLLREHGPMAEELEEIAYRLLTEIESANDARSRELYSDEYRKDKEVEHRLRIDKRAKELTPGFRKFDIELKKLDLEITNLKERKIPLEARAGIALDQLIKERLSQIREENEEAD